MGEDRVCRPAPEVESLPFAVLVSDDDILGVLDLARCIGADDAIAAAMLWQCCLRGPVFLRDGLVREGAVVCRLSEDDYVRCVSALPRLLLLRRDIVLATMNSTNAALFKNCRNLWQNECRNSINALASKYAQKPPAIEMTNPAPDAKDGRVWYGAWMHPGEYTTLCEACSSRSLQELGNAFDMYWRQDLPKLFQL